MNTQAIELPPSGEAAAVLLPDPGTVFLARAERFDALALHHGLGEWLAFLGRLSHAQHAALQASAQDITPPAEDVLERAAKHRMPPITAGRWYEATLIGGMRCLRARASTSSAGGAMSGAAACSAACWARDRRPRKASHSPRP